MFDKKSLVLENQHLDKIRPTLSRFSTDFITRLQRRSAFKINEKLYSQKSFDFGKSYLEYVLAKKEQYYQAIGRFRHDSEFPITDVSNIKCVLEGTLRDPISEVKCDISSIVPFYASLIPRICQPGENEGREGQIADLDAEAIISLSRRVNGGRYVAQDKYIQGETSVRLKQLLQEYRSGIEGEIMQCLYRPEQEKAVLDGVESLVLNSSDITLDEKVIRSIFKEIIDITMALEIDFLVKNYAGKKPE